MSSVTEAASGLGIPDPVYDPGDANCALTSSKRPEQEPAISAQELLVSSRKSGYIKCFNFGLKATTSLHRIFKVKMMLNLQISFNSSF